jgi:ethanolamine utilization protein EutN
MRVARVAGTVVSTISFPFFDEKRLLLCEYVNTAGEAADYTIAVDVVDAGVGELVLVLDEGNSSRQIFDVDTGPIRATVVGIVDYADFGGLSLQGP